MHPSVQSSKSAKLPCFYGNRFVVCKVIQLKIKHFIMTLKGTMYPKFSYLAIAVNKLSA